MSCIDIKLTRETHWEKHLRSKHAGISDLNPFVQAGVESKDLHAEKFKKLEISTN